MTNQFQRWTREEKLVTRPNASKCVKILVLNYVEDGEGRGLSSIHKERIPSGNNTMRKAVFRVHVGICRRKS